MDFFSRGQIGFFSGGDFLELQDLDNPAYSSSSENSSDMSISLDECFDSMAFLQDLEDPILEQNDVGSLVCAGGSNSGSDEFFKTTGSVPNSASGSRTRNQGQKACLGGSKG
ncbi:hypothetical protein CRYUN_Cryun35bG0024600 [Craigia yunnanensis]